jgi:hypothetical protein
MNRPYPPNRNQTFLLFLCRMENNTPCRSENSSQPFPSIEFNLSPDQISSFFPVLQKGFKVKARVGVSIQAFLSDHLGLTPEYIRDRVKTIFLDGKSVDDLEETLIRDGSTLALSAALPGLAGAVLRRGSPFAGLRSRVVDREKDRSSRAKEGTVFLKLFNLLLPELGPLFLRKGILISGKDFQEVWESLPGNIRERFEKTIRPFSIACISLTVHSGS